MAEAWGRIAARYPAVTFVIMGWQPSVFCAFVPEHRIVRLPWMPLHTYPLGYLAVDIGCAPLADRPFNRSKSAVKSFEFALGGSPVVASPTVYGKVIDDGRTGLLASTADEWEAALSRLVEDEALRATYADALKRDVLAQWTLRRNLWRWPDAWRRLWRGSGG
jgi:glycosyltransferase involved in cell wall biosynthesis